jgi:hypothetical protein
LLAVMREHMVVISPVRIHAELVPCSG